VNAKPEQRRRILEDAAGIAGLHSRRHDAGLRLKGAEANLVRVGDVISQLKKRIDALKRQARQARRYKELSRQIRELEALRYYLAWQQQQQQQVNDDEAALQLALEGLGAETVRESQAVKQEATLAQSLQPLRDQEVTRAAVIARLRHAQDTLENQLNLATQRRQELAERNKQLTADAVRERSLLDEAQREWKCLETELQSLKTQYHNNDSSAETQLRATLVSLQNKLAQREHQVADLTDQSSELQAKRSSLESVLSERIAQHRDLRVRP